MPRPIAMPPPFLNHWLIPPITTVESKVRSLDTFSRNFTSSKQKPFKQQFFVNQNQHHQNFLTSLNLNPKSSSSPPPLFHSNFPLLEKLPQQKPRIPSHFSLVTPDPVQIQAHKGPTFGFWFDLPGSCLFVFFFFF